MNELTNEARAEGKLACTMPCKEEEGKSQLIRKIVQKVTVDYQRLSIVSNPDGVLTQDAVRNLLYQQQGIEVVIGSNLRLRTHFELTYKSQPEKRFLYVCSSTETLLADMRQEAFVCNFNVADAFPLFADKSLLRNQSFETLDELYRQTLARRVPLAEGKAIVSSIIQKQERRAKVSAEYCLGQLTQIDLDWRECKTTMEEISKVVVSAIRHSVYPQIVPAIDAINQTFQEWIDREYFATLQSNPLLHPKSVNGILPHLSKKYGRDDKVALLVVDGFTYWQYVILKDALHKDGFKTHDGCTLAWLPSITTLSRQAIFRGGVPQQDYKQSPDYERKLWQTFWQLQGFNSFEAQYISDKDEFAINEGVKRMAIVTVEMDEKMHSSTDNKDLMSLTENWCPRITEKIKTVTNAGYQLYLTTDHGSTLSYGWRPLTQVEAVFLYKDGSRGKRHLIYNNKDEQRRFVEQNQELPLLQHDNWLAIRDDSCFARENTTMITHGGSHFLEVVIPFVKIENS